jgi:hypothetical protein
MNSRGRTGNRLGWVSLPVVQREMADIIINNSCNDFHMTWITSNMCPNLYRHWPDTFETHSFALSNCVSEIIFQGLAPCTHYFFWSINDINQPLSHEFHFLTNSCCTTPVVQLPYWYELTIFFRSNKNTFSIIKVIFWWNATY